MPLLPLAIEHAFRLDFLEDHICGSLIYIVDHVSNCLLNSQIYIASRLTEPCIRVQQGDRLGIYVEEAPGAAAYTFQANDPSTLYSIVQNESTPISIGDSVLFDTLAFPYKYSVAAFVDTSQYILQ